MADVSSFIPSLQPSVTIDRHRYIHVVGASVFVSDRVEIDDAEHHFLGVRMSDGGTEAVWAVDVPHGEDPSDGAATDLFTYFGRSSEEEWAIAGRAVQLAEWARTHKFCGRCGTATVRSDNDRSMKCSSCSLLAYPRIAPAMITLVTRGEGADSEALLARGVSFRAPMYSCLAGFVEPGESLEQSVIREVREEVGVQIDIPTYVSSQPWPFPHSLMLGFQARWLSGEIVCDPTEIMDAQWYRRDQLPSIPPRISIARKLIDMWVADV